LRREDRDAWLKGSVGEARALLPPYEPALMVAHEVSAAVNSPKSNSEKLIEAVGRGDYSKITA
jgi:putative SOS response-associated peptidase YedK